MKYKSSVLDFSDSCIRQRRWLHLAPHPTAHYSMSQFTRGPGTQWQRAGPGVNLTHLWFETSDLKCFTELWSHNAPIPANKCFSQRPITERRGAECKAGPGLGRVKLQLFLHFTACYQFGCDLMPDMTRDPGERRDTVTNMNSWWVSPLATPRPGQTGSQAEADNCLT